MAGGAQKRHQKVKTIERLYGLFGQHKQIILANFTNVGSSQVQQIRKLLRKTQSTLIVSKNTLIKKVIQMRTQGIDQEEFKHLEAQHGGSIPQLKLLLPFLKDKVALIFSDASVYQLKQQVQVNKVPTEARVGALSPIDFAVPAGPTGLDPSQINFFHALNVSTKIVKGQIEITKDFKVCTKGKKVKASQAALLKKLNLRPFEYGMKISNVYDGGSMVPEEVFNIDPASLITKFQIGIKNLAGLALETGYPIEAVVPLIIGNAFKNIAALSIESGYLIPELSQLSSSQAVQKAPQVKVADKAPVKQAKPAKKEEPKVVEEEEEGGMGGLFD